MGYTTDFLGSFAVTPPLKPEHSAYLRKFAATRRIKRKADVAETLPDPIRVAAGLPIGDEGAYFVGAPDFSCHEDASIVDMNTAPGQLSWQDARSYEERNAIDNAAIAAKAAQPGLWCQWVPNEEGTQIEWDGGEKFYDYTEWLEYLVHHFLAPWGYTLNGAVDWQGEENSDMGTIFVKDNRIEAVPSSVANPGPSWEREATSERSS